MLLERRSGAAAMAQRCREFDLVQWTREMRVVDPFLPGHAWRVARLTEPLAVASGLGGEALEALLVAGLLHDIGKLDVPAALLQAPRRLLAEEQAQVRVHAEAGRRRAQASGLCETVAEVALHHHERVDGRGYPHGLAGDEIPLSARIVAVADVWDALVSPRSYKRAIPVRTSVALVRDMAGTHLDPLLVEAFFDLGLHEWALDVRWVAV